MLRDDLGTLVRQLEAHLDWLRRQGRTGVPAGPSPRRQPIPSDTAEAPVDRAADPSPTRHLTLEVVREELGECTRCKLHPSRTHIVFGVGNPRAALMFVGEAPGFDEDQQGEPFVGKAGQLLNKMITAMGLRRGDVYIANILKCRPPGNRNPEPDEVASCEPFLRRQIDAISPRIIVALGKFAAQTLLRSTAPISALRGRWHEYQGVPLMPTFHPAFLLRSPDRKRDAWHDLQQVMAEMKRLGLYPGPTS
jgi:DNA polymerase